MTFKRALTWREEARRRAARGVRERGATEWARNACAAEVRTEEVLGKDREACGAMEMGREVNWAAMWVE